MVEPKRTTLPENFEAMLAIGDVGLLKGVFEDCSLDARGGEFGQTALAFSACPDELARWLVERGADLGASDCFGETPLHARAGEERGPVDVLLELGANVNHDAGGRATPLHNAASCGNLGAARALLRHNANPDAINADGHTALYVALQHCSIGMIVRLAPMADLLLSAMAQPPRPEGIISVMGRSGWPRSAVTDEMQSAVIELGAEFEFHRPRCSPQVVEATTFALEHLYELFRVRRVAPRTYFHA